MATGRHIRCPHEHVCRTRALFQGYGHKSQTSVYASVCHDERTPKDRLESFKESKILKWYILNQPNLIAEFDAAVTARVFGYPTVKDYYQTASSTNVLSQIKTPLLVLHALDDPIAGPSFLHEVC